MLRKIKPNRKKSKNGSPTIKERSIIKGLLKEGYISQDIVHIINQGRPSTINPGRIAEIKKNNDIKPASHKEIQEYIKIQSSYDPRTLLNPYKDMRLIRAREAMISAVESFNNPSTTFKTESFCVLSNIAWTYLLHEKMERHKTGSTTLENGKTLSVSAILKKRDLCPVNKKAVIENLEKIIDIRNAVEHTFFVIDEEKYFGALFQSCCINFEHYMTEWFGSELSLTKELSLALQFAKLQKPQIIAIEEGNLPSKIKALALSIEENNFANDSAFQLKIHYTKEVTAKTNSELTKLIDYNDRQSSEIQAIKKVSKNKLTEKEVVQYMNDRGYPRFNKTNHQNFWKQRWPTAAVRNKKANKEYGEEFNGWGWYEDKWLPEVLKHCEKNKDKYSSLLNKPVQPVQHAYTKPPANQSTPPRAEKKSH